MIRFFKPRSLAEALTILADGRDAGLRPIAGGTDLVLELRDPVRRPRIPAVIDIWALPELRGIADDDGVLHVGALATFADLIASPIVRRRAPMLAAVSREVGGVQIQNRGTLGGNIGTGSPAGDTLPVLLAHDAEIVLASASGERRVPARSFYTGYRTSVARPDELITAVRIPASDGNFSHHRKVATRRAQAISKVLVAMCGHRRGDGGFDRLAIGIGSVAPTPIRAGHAEAAIAAHHGAWDADALAAVQDALARDLHPIDDLRSTARYRSAVAFNIIRRAIVGSA